MGSKMSGFLRTLWWIVLFFYLVCAEIWGMKCLEKRYYCKEELQLIDCSRAKLKAIPKSVPLVNYTTLNLRYNLLVWANFSVGGKLPNLKMVDLRDNPSQCKGFPDKTILGVITDWNYRGGVCENHQNDEGELTPTNNDYKYFIITRSRPCYFHNYLWLFWSQHLYYCRSSSFVWEVWEKCLNWSVHGLFRFPVS